MTMQPETVRDTIIEKIAFARASLMNGHLHVENPATMIRLLASLMSVAKDDEGTKAA